MIYLKEFFGVFENDVKGVRDEVGILGRILGKRRLICWIVVTGNREMGRFENYLGGY